MLKRVVQAGAAAAIALALSWPAAAQPATSSDAPQTAAAQPSALVVQRVKSGPVFAPDVKITDMDDEVGTLVGGYVGWLTDERLLLGGGAYWLANDPHGIDMFYGGVIVGWQVPTTRAFRFGARALIGGGEATLPENFFLDYEPRPGWSHPGQHPGPMGGVPVVARYWVTQDFFVFEPQFDALIRLGDRFGVNLGVGYRVIAGAEDFNDRLQGVTGSVAAQIGIF